MTLSSLFASRYNLVRTIGSGGMGEVCLVEDTLRDGKLMALKTMIQLGDHEAAEGFRAEFRNIRGVIHPHIPEVYDFGVLPAPDNRLYFTSEFVDGQPLDTLAERWSPEQLQRILVRVCRALAFLHSRGLLHRDIKPQNILARLDDSGDPALLKLVDFGLASQRGADTATGGTIDYMAPELIAGEQATVASDLYAVGMLIYRLATGRMPFDGSDPLAAARQRCTTEAPPALRFRPDLPVGLSDVISALIRTQPDDRPSTARRVIALLNEREGTEYPYETEATRSAYIRSAAGETHPAARAAIAQCWQRVERGQQPPALIIAGPKGIGRSHLIREAGSEMILSGAQIALIERDEDLAPGRIAEATRAMLIPNAAALSAEPLGALLRNALARKLWVVLGCDDTHAAELELPGARETVQVRPFDRDGVRSFVHAIFPENAFPAAFTEELYTWTLGFATALYDTLKQLLADDVLRIGLSGWELMPGQWNYPVHPLVAEYIDFAAGQLSPEALRGVRLLACSQTPLPVEVMQALLPDAVVREVEALEWCERGMGCNRLRFQAVSERISESLSEDQRHDLHLLLERAWSIPELHDHPQAKREALYHDFYSGAWHTDPVDAAATLRAQLDNGDNRWVRGLIESCLLHDPPPAIWAVMLDALIAVEYTEGNLETSSALLGRLLCGGEVDVTDSNLAQLARFAVLEEKLGRTPQARVILERCRAALPAGPDPRAGAVFGTLAWIAFKQGESEEARQLAEEGLVRIPPHSADAGQALLLNTVATLAFYRGDTDAAALFWNRCLEVNTAIHDRKGIATMYNNLGVLAAQSGDRLNARAQWEKCAEIAREINDVHRLAGIYNNLGIDALETGQLSEAEDYYLKALALFRRMKSPREQVEILSNLGELAYYRADFSRAQAYLQEALNLARTLGDHECEVEPLVYLGKLLLTLEQLERAESILESARHLAHDAEVKKGEGQALEALALLYARRGRVEDADTALRSAHTLLTEELDPLAELHLHLSECSVAAQKNDIDRVTEALCRARKIADIKWDPFTAARTLVYGLLFARERAEAKERSRVLRQLAVYPDLLWRYHWAAGRALAEDGAHKKALEEYGRGVTVLKAIAARLPEDSRNPYLNSPQIRQFKHEALAIKNGLTGA